MKPPSIDQRMNDPHDREAATPTISLSGDEVQKITDQQDAELWRLGMKENPDFKEMSAFIKRNGFRVVDMGTMSMTATFRMGNLFVAIGEDHSAITPEDNRCSLDEAIRRKQEKIVFEIYVAEGVDTVTDHNTQETTPFRLFFIGRWNEMPAAFLRIPNECPAAKETQRHVTFSSGRYEEGTPASNRQIEYWKNWQPRKNPY